MSRTQAYEKITMADFEASMTGIYSESVNDFTRDESPNPAAGWTQDYARKALRTEMRLEKALEGECYFDLVRCGMAKETMTAQSGSTFKIMWARCTL